MTTTAATPLVDSASGDGANATLIVDGVSKAYGDHVALQEVTLSIRPGEIVGLLGPNGAGKTTLVSIVAGLVRPDGGRVRVGGFDVLGHSRSARQLIGLAPQELAIYLDVSARRNLTFFAQLAGVPRRVLHDRVEEVAELLDLTGFLDRSARHLSGGERRRLHTAIALVARAPLILLDEPTAGSDVESRARIVDMVKALAAAGSAVLFSTHYLQEVEGLDASVALLERGRLIARGSLAELVAQHGDSSVELTFDGPAPEVRCDEPVTRVGSQVRIVTRRPAQVASAVLASLGDDSSRLLSLEVVRPNLEAVYLALTGRRYAHGQPGGSENTEPGHAS